MVWRRPTLSFFILFYFIMRHRQVYTASFFLAAAVSRPFNDLPFIPPFYLLDASLHNSILASALSDYFAQQLSQHDLKFTL